MGWFDKKQQNMNKFETDEDTESEDSEDDDSSENSSSGSEQGYPADIECDNCGEEISVDIPEGTTINDYKAQTICEYCGCYMNNKSKDYKGD